MEGRFRDAFGALSAQALQANTESFVHLANAKLAELQQSAKADLEARQATIDQMVKPIQEGMVEVDSKLQAFDRDRACRPARHRQGSFPNGQLLLRK